MTRNIYEGFLCPWHCANFLKSVLLNFYNTLRLLELLFPILEKNDVLKNLQRFPQEDTASKSRCPRHSTLIFFPPARLLKLVSTHRILNQYHREACQKPAACDDLSLPLGVLIDQFCRNRNAPPEEKYGLGTVIFSVMLCRESSHAFSACFQTKLGLIQKASGLKKHPGLSSANLYLEREGVTQIFLENHLQELLKHLLFAPTCQWAVAWRMGLPRVPYLWYMF